MTAPGEALPALAQRIPPWVDAIILAALSVAIALSALDAWHLDLRVPFAGTGDAASAQYIMKTVLEHGWYTRNPDVGAPFGATMYDYPIPEPTHFALIRLLGVFGTDPFLVFNLFYLFSFASTAVAAWWALRQIGIGRALAAAGGLLFTLLPYHFFRLPHVYLASYFAVPVLACYALRLALGAGAPVSARARAGTLLLIALAAGSGVYYAFFGCLFVAAGAILGATTTRRRDPLFAGAAYTAVIVAVIGLSLVPNFIFHLSEGPNAGVAERPLSDAETYGLRLSQLLLPSAGHRWGKLSALAANYDAHAPLVNENMTATLGILGDIGLLTALCVALFGPRERWPLIAAAGVLALVGIVFATIGGFGALFAFLVTPELRGLNRISVCIAFFAFVTLLRFAQDAIGPRPLAHAVFAVALIVVGGLDEVPARGVVLPAASAAPFHRRQEFFDAMQAKLAPGTAVFELPYMFFPESPKAGSLLSYALFEPYLRTRGLRFSFGDMHGRPADAWNEQVSTLKGTELVHALASAGFGAIYIDRNGYADHGAAVEGPIAAVLGAPLVEDPTHESALYRIPPLPVARTFVVVTAGKGWYPWGVDKEGSPRGNAKGSADLIVANPSGDTEIEVRFTLTSAEARRVTIAYGALALGDYALAPGAPRDIDLRFRAGRGVSHLTLSTDAPAAAGRTDPQPATFSLDDLAYGAAP